MNRMLLILIGLSITGSFTVGSELNVLPEAIDGTASAGMMQRFLIQKVYEAIERRAAALEPQLFDSITLRHRLGSWTKLLRPLAPADQLVTIVHGVLKTYDLPDLRAKFPSGKLSLKNAP